ncbi:MAG TPA: AMP-binding protein, partial [Acidobacteriaceae bacterium]|nr:AMP-binding protein [Acidobacteriaceae bacterium]
MPDDGDLSDRGDIMTDTAIPRAWIQGDPCQVPAAGVHELFLARAQRSPDALAVRQWDTRLTYRQLAARAAALATRLRAAGAEPGARVGVCMRRTPLLPASELAVAMAGGTFVPLDPDHPPKRLQSMIEDAEVKIALVDADGARLLEGVVTSVAASDPADGADADPDAVFRPVPAAAGDCAYVMFTSGSTGRPKGVMISHGSLTAFVSAINQHLGESPGHRLAAFAAIGFDVSIYEFFAPLVSGGSIHLVSEAERSDPGRLQQ